MLSVVIPTCNRPSDLAQCLRLLANKVQEIPSDYYEIIVTDDGRKNSAMQICEQQFDWVKYTQGPAMGPGANRNHGATIARFPWLIFIDDDCLPEPGLLRCYYENIKLIQPTEMIILTGLTLQTEVPPSLLWEVPHNPAGRGDITANFAIPSKAFESVGRFDERFRVAYEDIEFFSRFRLLGGSVHVVHDARVRHPLRKIPAPAALARRWEGKLIMSFDQGAPISTIAWRLPWHALRVIQSRFRNKNFSLDNLTAAFLFAREWLHILLHMYAWLSKWSQKERSPFWVEHTNREGPPPKYGF